MKQDGAARSAASKSLAVITAANAKTHEAVLGPLTQKGGLKIFVGNFPVASVTRALGNLHPARGWHEEIVHEEAGFFQEMLASKAAAARPNGFAGDFAPLAINELPRINLPLSAITIIPALAISGDDWESDEHFDKTPRVASLTFGGPPLRCRGASQETALRHLMGLCKNLELFRILEIDGTRVWHVTTNSSSLQNEEAPPRQKKAFAKRVGSLPEAHILPAKNCAINVVHLNEGCTTGRKELIGAMATRRLKK